MKHPTRAATRRQRREPASDVAPDVERRERLGPQSVRQEHAAALADQRHEHCGGGAEALDQGQHRQRACGGQLRIHVTHTARWCGSTPIGVMRRWEGGGQRWRRAAGLRGVAVDLLLPRAEEEAEGIAWEHPQEALGERPAAQHEAEPVRDLP